MPDQTKEVSYEICPTCGVRIEEDARVVFSAGPAGTRARLRARVCQFVDSPDCINQDESKIGVIPANDYYQPI